MASVVWEYMDRASRERYAREHNGVGPPGYQGMGSVEWFKRWHDDEAPCIRCGVLTGRWVIGTMSVRNVAWGTPHVDQPMGPAQLPDKKRALCTDTVWAFCSRCEDVASIASLKKTLAKPELLASVREASLAHLAELEASLLESAA